MNNYKMQVYTCRMHVNNADTINSCMLCCIRTRDFLVLLKYTVDTLHIAAFLQLPK